MKACRPMLLRKAIQSPWRGVLVLGITQIITWGTAFYSVALVVPLIAAERGWSLSFAMSGFSLALLAAGVASPRMGAAVDRHGGHWVMATGSLVGAAGLLAIVHATHPAAYLAAWIVLGLGLSCSLYDAAFATLGRIFGAAARKPITILTLAGGFASTAGWPATHLMVGIAGWDGTYLVFAAILALVCAPLHALALPRGRADRSGPAATQGNARPETVLPSNGIAFYLVAGAFAAYAFAPAALSAHMLTIFERNGIDAASVVVIGALFGPAQVSARMLELGFGSRLHSLALARIAVGILAAAFALLAIAGLSIPTAAAFAILFGMSNGLITIARGAVPLALFGPSGYGALIGRIAAPWLAVQAASPLALALIIERASDAAAMALTAAFVVLSLACFAAIRQPSRLSRPHSSRLR